MTFVSDSSRAFAANQRCAVSTSASRKERSSFVSTTTHRGSGFTLVEMMVALVAGALVVTSVYYIGTVTTRQFVEQDEISRLQQGLRLTANRLKRDVERAGFLSTPNLIKTRALCDPSGPNGDGSIDNFAAVHLDNNGSIAALGGATSAEVKKNAVELDSIVLTGNFITVDEQVAEFQPPNRLVFRTDLQGFRRNFVAPDGSISAEAFTSVYVSKAADPNGYGRHIRVVNQTGRQMYFRIGEAGLDATTGLPYVTLNSDGTMVNELLSGPCSGAYFFVTPIMAIKYHVVAPGDANYPGTNRLDKGSLHGTHAALVRVEVALDPTDPFKPALEIESTAQIVLDNVVFFDVDFVSDKRDAGEAQPLFADVQDESGMNPNSEGSDGAHRLRSAIIRVGTRGPREDPKLKWPYPGDRSDIVTEPMWRYDAVPDVDGTARVRELRIEVPLPNVANADPDIRGAT